MNFKRFFRLSLSAALLAGSPITAAACGPYISIIPSPNFFYQSNPYYRISDSFRQENLRLWQSQTSPDIPLADFEDIVYYGSAEQFYHQVTSSDFHTANKFLVYLRNTGDSDIMEFLYTAKNVEQSCGTISSPWYYPSSPYSEDGFGLPNLIEKCRNYAGTRLKDRYALQTTRALFTSRQYAECIEYADTAFSSFPDSNLMKRMARQYVAGCWSRLGDKERADTFFAVAGDIRSISPDKRVRLMTELNPNTPQLIDYIRCNADDSLFMQTMVPVARRMIRDPRVKNKGDWNFLLAFVDYHYHNKPYKARAAICRAMNQSFSSEELQNTARAYKMKLDGLTGNRASLLADLKWMDKMTDCLNPDASLWSRRCQNIIYAGLIPMLWRDKDYSTAILLCAYADSFERYYSGDESDWYPYYWISHPKFTRLGSNVRANDDKPDYGSLSSQMMGSLTSQQLVAVYENIFNDTPLFNFLRQWACVDKNYFNELIGTIAIREENYARAITYLSKVDTDYLEAMNINCGYLARDPFIPYPSRWGEDNERSLDYSGVSPCDETSNPSGKIKFAQQMLDYQRKMKRGRTADERGMARLMYAIGRRNSYEECWALTQYWRGESCVFEPRLDDWNCVFERNNYSFLYDYNPPVGHKATEELYRREVDAALAMLTSDEAKAQAHYLLGNIKTVIKLYGNTSTARLVKSTCDRWRQWL